MLSLLLPLLLLAYSTRGFLQQLQSQFPASSVAGNRIVCQNFTDFLPSVVFMYAADDFVVPQPDLALRYTALQLQLGLLRMKRDGNPLSFTVQLMRNNDADDSPGAPFFAHSYAVNWSDAQLDVPFNLTLQLRAGDTNELDTRVPFDPMDEVLLPRDTRHWLGVYATGPRHWSASMAENSVFWCTAAPSARNASLANGNSNRPYFFRDPGDALREGFVNWTAAPAVERAFGMDSVSLNLAWSLSLVAQDTVAPTGAPTNASTGGPNATGVPSAAPSGTPTEEEEIVWPNVSAPTTASNGTTSVINESNLIRIVVSVIITIVVTCCLCALCLVYCIKRRKMQSLKGEKIQLQNLNGQYRDEKGAVRLTTFEGQDGSMASFSEVSLTNESCSTTVGGGGGGGRYDTVQSSDEHSMSEFIDMTPPTVRNRGGGGGGS